MLTITILFLLVLFILYKLMLIVPMREVHGKRPGKYIFSSSY